MSILTAALAPQVLRTPQNRGNSNEAGFLALVDADARRLRWRVHAHDGFIPTPGISAEGRLIVSTGRDGVRFLSLRDGSPLRPPLPVRGFPADAQPSPDGRFAAIALLSRLELWDVRTGRLVRSLKITGGIDTARFSPDGRLLAVANASGVQLLSTADWTPVTRQFSGHAGGLFSVAISRDNRTLITGSFDGTVRLWDIHSEQAIGAPLPGLPGHGVNGMLTPDSNTVIAGYDTGQAYRWDIRRASLTRQACMVAGRALTREEWDEFLPGRDYEPACTD